MRLAALCLALAPLVCAAQATDPLNLFNRARAGDTAAFAQLRTAAEGGDAASQFQLGRAYSFGASVKRDDAVAAQWLEKAATQGHAEAQSNLGYLYSAGLGVPKDNDKAMQWWVRSAENGFVQAQFNVALAYWQGKLVPKDETKAFEWMRKAAEQGAAPAQLNLGLMYYRGNGTSRDLPQAAAWYRKAVDQGNETAMTNLAAMYAFGEGVAKDPAEALRLLRRPFASGSPNALALRKDLCSKEPAACAAEKLPDYFVFEMTDPKVRIVIPDIPPIAMGPHPLNQPHTRAMGAAADYTISVLTPTADTGMSGADCARSLAGSVAKRWGLKREDAVVRRTNEQTLVMLFPVVVERIVQLKAYVLSGAEGHCVEVHLSKISLSKDDIGPWLRGFGAARIESY